MPENVMLKEAIEAIHHGQRGRARDLLTRLLRSDQSNPEYWLWMSSVVDSQKEREYCLQTVLRLDPGNLAARQGLVLMGASQPAGDVTPVAPMRRKWEVQAEPEPQPGGLRGVWRNPLLRGIAFGLLAIVVLGLVFAGIFGLGFGRRLTVALRPTKTPGPPPTFTVTPTFIPSTRVATITPTPTLAGPNPLWMRLAETYTPTPLYVSTPHAISEAFRAGQRAYVREDWASALKYMQQAAQVDPNAADIQYIIGEVQRFLGENEDASEAYERALAINPNFGPAYLGRARLHLELNPGADVLADLQLAIEKDPGFGEAYLERANYLLGDEDLEAALQDLQKAESLIPGSPLVFLYRAEIALKQGEFAEALDFARKANQADVTLLPAYRVLGQAALANRENSLALETLQTYTLYAPEDALAWSLLGQAYYEMVGRRQDALEALNWALELDGELEQAYLYRGLTYLGLDQGQLAVNDFVKARRIDARSFNACVGLARALLVTGRLNEARDQLNHCLDLTEREEDQAAVYYWRAQVLETSGNPPAAVKDWQALLDLPKESVPSTWAKTAQARLAALWTPTPVPPSPTPSRTPKASSTPKATPSPTKTATPASPTPRTSTPESTPLRR